MSQAPNPFTQAASQGYGDFAATLDEQDLDETNEGQQMEDEEELEGPQSPVPEEEQEINEFGFTQTQERSYPTGADDLDEDENDEITGQIETSDNEQEEYENDNDEQAGPSSPQTNDSNEQQEEEVDDHDRNRKQSQSQHRRRVQIMNDSDNDEEQPTESTSVTHKDKNHHVLKKFVMKHDNSHKKRHHDEHQHRHENTSKRLRKTSNDDKNEDHIEDQVEKDTDNIEATSDVEDVVEDIFGKEINDNDEENDDQDEVAAELRELNDNDEEVQQEDDEDTEQVQNVEIDEDQERSVERANRSMPRNNIMYDIDVFLEKRAERRRGNRRRGRDSDIIDISGPDSDQLVSNLINKMKIATEEDRIFNKNRQPATAKLLLLPSVQEYLCRADLTESFLDHGILTVFKDWLSPLPDKSLPNIKIRELLIKILQRFGIIDADRLRDCGIGKALMHLYRHPRETKENKIKLMKIIHDWARPIFNLDTDYKLLTREERQQRDVDQASLKRQTSLTGKQKNRSADVDLPFNNDRQQGDDDDLYKDDDCPRARVPRPSNKDYVVRPASTVEYSDKKGDGKRTISRLDTIKRRQQDRKRLSKPMSIVKLSIEGNKMHL